MFRPGAGRAADRRSRLVLFLASRRGDVLSGRFLDACGDYERLVGQAEEVERENLLVLRL